MAWKPAMKSDSESGGSWIVGVCDIKDPRTGCASDLADMGRSSAAPVHDRADGMQIRGDESQLELHAIVGDFEAGIQDGAMLGGALVEDRVGVIDVDQDAAAMRIAGEEFEQTFFA